MAVADALVWIDLEMTGERATACDVLCMMFLATITDTVHSCELPAGQATEARVQHLCHSTRHMLAVALQSLCS
jgi:oligoribonuclease (3'-5' exoribonuclease)